MASLSPHRSSSSLRIQELSDVLELLKKCGFFETRWFDLGLALGLSKTTLDTIRANHPQDTHQCLIECLSKWLKRADAVDSKGGATWDSLSTGLRSINENAVPDMLNQEILQRSQVLAVSIFDKHHPVLSESVQVKEGNETNGTASPSTKIVKIPVPRSMSEEFSSIRASYATMSLNVCKAIKAACVDLDDLKDFIIIYDSSLEGKINDCDTLSSVLRVIDKECSLVDITLFRAVVEHFKVAEAEKYIEEYRTKSIALCLKEKLKAIEDYQPSLQSEKVIYTFDWQPEEKKLEDIKDILSEMSGKLVGIEYIDSTDSITATCNVPSPGEGTLSKEMTFGVTVLQSSLKAKEAVTESLKEGTFDLTVTRINMHGVPGSGKTCSQLLLLNQDPPAEAVTDSTPLACRAVKATRVSCDGGSCWESIDGEKLLRWLASELKEVTASDEKSKPEPVGDITIEREITKRETTKRESTTEATPNSGNPADETPASDVYTAVNADDKDSNSICQQIADLAHLAKTPLNRHWIYIIDCGGQPAFQELLPLFTRPASLNIITIDLSKGIDRKLEYNYRHGKEEFPIGSKFKYTNVEYVMNVIRSGAISCPISTESNKEKHPMYFILGTHYDKAPEKFKDVNTAILSSVKSLPEKQKSSVIEVELGDSDDEKEIVYPINCIEEDHRKRSKAAKDLCQFISNCSGDTSLEFSMRIVWFAFELTLQQKADNTKRSYLTKEEVVSAGKTLRMSEEDIEEALQYFHKITIILYYPDVLPDIVFVDPKPILDILSHLLALTYVNRRSLHHVAKKTPDRNEIDQLKEKGIFSESLLSKLNDDENFPKTKFVNLLLHLHIIAKTEDGYFIPCALKSYNGPPPVVNLKPLLIVWYNPDTEEILPVPHGVFPLTIVHLMNHKEPQFRIPPPSNEYFKYRDAMSFRIRLHGDHIGTIHIINKYKHIEVYFDGDEPAKYCPSLCELIREAIKCSSVAVGARQCHKLAFICSSKNKEKCYCIVTNEEKEKVECSFCPKPAIIKDQEYWNWFHYTPQSSSKKSDPRSDPSRCLDITWLREVRKSLEEKQFFESEWEKLGDELGLYPNTLDTIKTKNPRDVSGCLRDMLLKWLQGADGVLGKGESTWASLVNALESIGHGAVAEHIRCKWIKRKKPPSTP